ncbi:MAG: DUF503 domain-containing protein [Myxococcota bacterium]
MVVGICRVELALPGNDSLKGKRSVVRRVIDRVRARFKVSCAEVDALDVHEAAAVGFAVVSNDGRHAARMMESILKFIEGVAEAPVVEADRELIHLDDVEPAPMGEEVAGSDDRG